IIGGGDGLEMQGNDLGGGDELGGVLLIGRAQLVADFGGGLGGLDADAGQLGGQLEPFLRGGGLEGRKPEIAHVFLLLSWGISRSARPHWRGGRGRRIWRGRRWCSAGRGA